MSRDRWIDSTRPRWPASWADHAEQFPGTGGTIATAEVVQHGIVGALVGWVFGGLVRRYLRAELAGVRSRAEAGVTPEPNPASDTDT